MSDDTYQTEAERKVISMMTPTELVAYNPVSPVEMEELIFQLGERLERAPGVIVKLYEDVHRKTERLESAFADAVLEAGGQISFARFFAKQKTAPLLNELNVAKEALRYAEELSKALTAKYFGYLNVNKSISAQFMGSGGQRY